MFDVQALLTPESATGTDRVAEASRTLDHDLIINLQGDEPLINSNSLQSFVERASSHIATDPNVIINGISSIKSEQAFDPNNVKCAFNRETKSLLYLSRKSLLNSNQETQPAYYKQLGLYAMLKVTLQKFQQLKPGQLECAEKIEMLRWIESGQKLIGCDLAIDSISVDTPDDFLQVTQKISALWCQLLKAGWS